MSHSQVLEVDFRVVHPVPLTVADVVSEFHVLDALSHGQRCGSQHPSDLALAQTDHEARGDLEATLKSDGATDIGPVFRAKRILNINADRLQVGGECLQVRDAEMSVFSDIGNGHRPSNPFRRDLRSPTCRLSRATQTM